MLKQIPAMILVAALALPAAAAVTITETILPVLGTGGISSASAVNEKMQVVGYSYTSGLGLNRHAFLWEAGQGMQDLGTLGGDESFAESINASGVVVGYSNTSSGEVHPFLWNGTMHDLGNLPGYDVCLAKAISNSGVITGFCYTTDKPDRGFLWSKNRNNGAPIIVADPPLASVEIMAISPNGELAGEFVMPGSVATPAIWSDGIATQLAVPAGFAGGELNDLNSQGESVGVVFNADFSTVQATMWTNAGDPIPVAPNGHAWAINNNGEVVGDTYVLGSGTRAFFWSPSTGVVLMGNGIWAFDINNGRVAVGQAAVEGVYRAAVWTITITP